MGTKILIVDDSITIRQQLNFVLSKAGFAVVEAVDGQFALTELEKNSDVAMVISDVNMPNMNGLELVEAIKALPKHEKLPIVMLTTEGSIELIERAKRAGAKGWLVKPFQPDQLVAAVTKLTA